MAKQLNIDLSVNANTAQAKQAMLELQSSLDKVIQTRTVTINDTSINQAKQAALDLKRHLEAATNVNTGKMDLSKFSASLSKSGQSLQGLYNQLSQIGPQGQQAFLALSQSMSKADMSAVSLGSKIGGLATTLKNTAKWQISSSLLHGFMGAIQGAYGYAQDLNESLNNIRIITGQNVDEMSKFAIEANNSAKALSATTTEYTNASLIYYQQGLSSDEVKARTDATIKLANVSRQSAEEVSSQMTAIWNNFADGNDNLEYYEDVITKLGATTASSSSEIAEGLQKFASVADTVDLSYEKASASLATVVAETRQSADVVGTAFKTLFARLEGLNLGETLEDGTDLNKYSAALKSVGVNIKDQSGELKSMDNILNEIGAKWETLGKDQQVALAQTVAGVRQYTQFIALMDNYDKVLQNEKTARNSSGTVDEQAKIYAESWEAARDRVTAAAQEIYDQLLDDEAFISILNGLETFLDFISNIIDGLGGLQGVLLLIGSIFMQQYAKEMPAFIEKMTTNVRILTGVEEKRRQAMLKENAEIINNQMGKSGSAEVDAQIAGLKKVSTMYADLASKRSTLSEAEIASYENLIREAEARTQIAQSIGKEIDALKRKSDVLETSLKGQMGFSNSKNKITDTVEKDSFKGDKQTVMEGAQAGLEEEERRLSLLKQQQEEYNKLQKAKNLHGDKITEAQKQALKSLEQEHGSVKNLNKKVNEFSNSVDKMKKGMTGADLFNAFKKGSVELGKTQGILNHVNDKMSIWQKKMQEVGKDPEKLKDLKNEMSAYADQLEKSGVNVEQLQTDIQNLSRTGKTDIDTVLNSFKNMGEEGIAQQAEKLEKLKIALEHLGMDSTKLNSLMEKLQQGAQLTEEERAELERMAAQLDDLPNHGMKASEIFTKIGSSLMQVAMVWNSLKNLGSIWTNEDLDAGEKVLQTMTALGTIIPGLVGLYELLFVAKNKDTEATLAGAIASGAKAAADAVATAAQWALNIAMDANPIGAVILAITALIALLVALAVAIAQVIGAENEKAKALKEEKDAAAELHKTYDDLKNKYEELKQTISDYNNSLEAIKKLTKGTQEWKDAVRDANEEAQKIIQTYRLIKDQDYTIDSNGIIQIDSKVLKNVQQQESDNLDAMQAATIEQDKRVEAAEVDKLKTKAMNSIVTNGKSGDNDKAHEEKLAKYEEQIVKNGYLQAYQNGTMSLKEIAKELKGNWAGYNSEAGTKKILEYLEAKEKYDTTEQSANAQIAAAYTAQDSKIQNSKNKESLDKASGKIYSQINEQNYKNLEKELKEASDEDRKKYAKEYAKMAGLDKLAGFDMDKLSLDKDGKIKYTVDDENGKPVEKEVNAKTVKAALSSADNQKDLTEALHELDATITNLQQSAAKGKDNKGDNALASVLSSQDLGSATHEEANAFSSDVDSKYDGDMKKYLEDKLGLDELTDEAAQKFGFESAKKMVDSFNEQKKGIEEEWKNITLGEDGLKSTEKLSLDTSKKIQAQFDKIRLGGKGDAGVKEFSEGLNEMVSELPEEKKVKALEELGNIDWSSWDAMEQAQGVMSKFNVNIDLNSEKWKNLTKNIRAATGAMPDAAAEMEKLKNVIIAVNKLKPGETVDSTTYETITKQTQAWKKYFQAQADGTYKFIGNAEDMKKATADQFAATKKELTEFENLQKGFNGVTFEDNEGEVQPIAWGNAQGSTSAAEYLSKYANSKGVKDVLEKYDWDKEKLDKAIADAQETDEEGNLTDKAKKAQAQLDELYSHIDTLRNTNYQNEKEKQDQIYASTADTYEKLENLKNSISKDAYDQQVEIIKQNTLAAAESLEQLDAAIQYVEQNGATVTFEDQCKALTNLASQYKNTTVELEAYNDAVANITSDTNGNMSEGSKEALAKATDNLRAAIAAGEAAEKYSLDADVIEAQAKSIKKVNEDLGMTAEQATKVAIANERMNAGVKTLHESFEDWKETLKTADKTSLDYAQAVADTTKAIKNLLAVSDDWELPDEFLDSAEHLDWLTQAAEGSEEAINKIGLATAKAGLEAKEADQAIITAYNHMIEQGKITGELLSVNDFNTARDEVINGIDDIQNHLNELLNGSITLDDVIDTESFVESLNQVALTTGMTVEEMNDTLNSIGVQAQVETISIPKRVSVPTYREYKQWHAEPPEKVTYTDATGEHTIDNPPDGYYETYTVPGPTYEVDGYEQIAQISTAENPIKPSITNSTAPVYTGVGGTANKGSTNRGGGVSKSSTSSDKKSDSSSDKKTTSAASHEHEVNRYSDEKNAIESLSKQYDRLSDAKDKAFGASKVQAMEQELKKLKQLKNASKNYLDAIAGSGNGSKIAESVAQGRSIGSMIMNGEVGGTAAADYRALHGGRSASGKNLEYVAVDSDGNQRLVSDNYSLGGFNSLFNSNISFQLDSSGKIQNRDAILNTLQRMKNQEEDNYSSLADPTGAQQTEHNRRLAYLEEMKERIEQMDQTANDLSDAIDEYLDYITEIQEKNGEIIVAKMENGVELGNKTQQKLDRAIKILGNNIYKSVESMRDYYDKFVRQGAEADKIKEKSYDKAFDEGLNKFALYEKNKYDENAITPEQMAELAETAEAGYDELIDNALARVERMSTFYADTLDYWNEKIQAVNSSIEVNIETLNHFQNVLSLLGRSTDYKAMNVILRGQLEANQAYYQEKKRLTNDKKTAYDKALADYQQMKREGKDEDALETFYNDTVKTAKEDYEQSLQETQSLLETTLENINSIYENSVNEIFDTFENGLVGVYGSFDYLDQAMSRQKAIADEYLTKTNQLYETNKMLRSLSQDIDKTDSSIAKRRLKDFAEEIEALKTKEKLSKSDLEIAQSRYEILKAELALEEAKNAKTTVRLQRDGEGNYGYVYTADQDKIADAEAALEEKQNNFYNLLKTQAEEAGQKIIQINKEWMDAIKALEEERESNSLMSKEEYEFKKAQIDEQYKAQLLAAQETHDTAISYLNEVAVEGQTETWTNGFEDILSNMRIFSGNSQDENNNLSNSLESRIKTLHKDLDGSMQWLEGQRKKYENDTKLGNDQIVQSTRQVSNEVKSLVNQITGKGGLADATKTATNEARELTKAFVDENVKLQQVIESLRKKADRCNDVRQRMITLTEAQREYNEELERTNRLQGGGGAGGYSGGGSGDGGGSGGGGGDSSGGGGNGSGGGNNRGNGTWYCTGRYEAISGDYSKHKVEKKNTATGYLKWFTEPHVWRSYSEPYGTGYKCNGCGMMRMYILSKDQTHIADPNLIRILNVGTGKVFIKNKSELGNYGIYGLRSGGYTGTWPASGKTGLYTGSWSGPDAEENGKLAFLHQKELVLNAADTENMLEAVKLIRQISQQIDLQAISQSSGFAATAAQFFGDREPLQQDITIHAEFPNATDHNEIEQAFNNLANKASQFANRY